MTGPNANDAGEDPRDDDPLREEARREAERARAAEQAERRRRARGPFATDLATLEAECELTFVRGSGPGGQHRNKVETGVRLVHPPSGITITATDDRSQTRNREQAFERLVAKLEQLNRRPKTRKKKRVSKAQKRKRVDEKKKRGQIKKMRRDPRGE